MYDIFIGIGEIFLKLLNVSITASWLVIAIVLAKFIIKKAPKWINCVLWSLVAIRLLIPFDIESPLSLIPSRETMPVSDIYNAGYVENTQAFTPQVDSGMQVVDAILQPAITETTSASVLQSNISIIACVWLIGIAAMLVYSFISFLKVKKSISEAMYVQENIYLCDNISTPFILGIIKPKIYLPSSLYRNDVLYVIDHEKAHIKRLDHLWKPLGYLILTLYWFNPVMWVAYVLLCKDIELACDERVIKELDKDCKKEYSNALINCSSQRRLISACPLAFGETAVKDRIKSVLNYKKPAFWMIIVSLVLCVAISVGFLTVPRSDSVADILDEKGYRIVAQEDAFIPVSIPMSVFTDEIYNEKGQKFKKNQVMVFEYDGTGKSYCQTNIYLEEAIMRDSKIDLSFRFSYDALQDCGVIYTGYYAVDNWYPYTIDVNDVNTLKIDGEHYYENDVAVKFWAGSVDSKGGMGFGVSVSKDAFLKAKEKIIFDIFCTKTGYEKESCYRLIDDELSAFIENTVLEKEGNNESLPDTSFKCASFIPLKAERENGNIKVYFLTQPSSFDLMKGKITFGGVSSANPATITVKKEKDGYSLEDFWIIQMNNTSKASQVKEHFPEEVWEQANNGIGYYYDILHMKNQVKANEYFASKTKEYTGEYVFYGAREEIKPTLTLLPGNRFAFSYSPLSSFIPQGEYTTDGNQLCLYTDYDKGTYYFYITEEGFVFDAYNSAEIPEYKISGDSEETYCPVPDGAVFIAKQAVGANSYFDAVVLEIYDGSILVEPLPDESLSNSANKLNVSTRLSSSASLPKLYVGDEVRICYDGMIQETFPAKISGTIAIYQLESLKAESLKDTLIAEDVAMLETISLPSANAQYCDGASNVIDRNVIDNFVSVFNEIYSKAGVYEIAEDDEDYQGSVFIITAFYNNSRHVEIKILGKEFIRFGKNDLRQITEFEAERLINMFKGEKGIHEKAVETTVGEVDMPEWTFRETSKKATKNSNAEDLYKLFSVEPFHTYEDGADYYACYNDNYVLVVKYGEYARRYERTAGSGVTYTPID